MIPLQHVNNYFNKVITTLHMVICKKLISSRTNNFNTLDVRLQGTTTVCRCRLGWPTYKKITEKFKLYEHDVLLPNEVNSFSWDKSGNSNIFHIFNLSNEDTSYNFVHRHIYNYQCHCVSEDVLNFS